MQATGDCQAHAIECKADQLVAAIKLATRNRKGRHLSTARAIELAEKGFYLEGRFEQIPKGLLKRSRCDRWMDKLGIKLRHSLRPEPCVRFEARESNECWQFDVFASDVYYLAEQKLVPEAGQSGYSHLGLFSVVEENLRSEVPSDLPGGITLPAGTMQAVFCRGQILR